MQGMPPVSKCDVGQCFYNRQSACHAPAINVGGNHPECDAFIANGAHNNRPDVGMVGACHVVDCRFNSQMTCSAQAIQVTGHSGHADCATYQHA